MLKGLVCCLLVLVFPLGAVTRLAIDVGSSATKYEIAEVEKGKIAKVLLEKEEAIAIEQDIKQSGTEIITDNVRHKLEELLEEAKKAAEEHGVTEYGAVATGAFRLAKNGESFLERIEKDTGLKIELITENQEAILGFEGAAESLRLVRSDLVVWDLGGGTMEMVAREGPKKYDMYLGDMGSVGFRSRVIREVKRQNPKVVVSANPMSGKQIEAAVALAKKAAGDVEGGIGHRLKTTRSCVVGIGALAFLDVGESKGGCHSLGELKAALAAKADKTDKDLGETPYVGSTVTDLALVVGFMEELGFRGLYLMDLSLTTGLLVSPAYISPFPSVS